jgi:MFS family permease
VATIGAIYGLKSFGRKPILLTGNFGLGLCDVLIGILFLYIDQFDTIFWIVFALLIVYMGFYGLTIGPVVWMYVPEIIPAKVVPFATTLNWLGSSFCLIIAPIINESLGSSAVFFIFGGLTLFMGIINTFSIVEIKGLNVKQICEAYR